MALAAAEKANIIKDFQLSSGDTGCPEVQVALLTTRIRQLTEHMKANIHDHHSRRGLLQMVSKRRKLLNYVKKVNIKRYSDLIGRLGIRR